MDPITDLCRRLSERLGAPLAPDIDAVAAEVRRDWGGERPYIARNGEGDPGAMERRNRAILREWRGGERVAYLARRYGISRQRVWQIVREAGGL